MKVLPFLTLCVVVVLTGCAHRWVVLTEREGTRYFVDVGSAMRASDSVWEVRERFLEIAGDRFYLEAEVLYDCRERTFMTLWTRGFSEHRPLRRPEVLEGNVPVKVAPGSGEEERLQGVCEILEGGERS